jgi:hypothetical protein
VCDGLYHDPVHDQPAGGDAVYKIFKEQKSRLLDDLLQAEDILLGKNKKEARKWEEDFKGKGTEITFYGYASKEARDSGKQPLSAGKVQIAGDDYVAGADRAALYAIIKQKPEFEGATDA